MPSPRAVLADIHDFKLDPKKAHKNTGKTGRIMIATSDVDNKSTSIDVQNIVTQSEVVEEPIAENIVVESVENVEVIVVEHVEKHEQVEQHLEITVDHDVQQSEQVPDVEVITSVVPDVEVTTPDLVVVDEDVMVKTSKKRNKK